jgi:3,4-dihydroxy 2-butanone 4-phosphate synthase/GTP cyclohydrolase II
MEMSAPRSSVTAAIESIRRGDIVIVTDDEDRENEGDLIMAAEAATADTLAFFLQHTSGLICVGVSGECCDALELSPMVQRNRESQGTAFTVSVDLAAGITTGISAVDRAATVRRLGAAEAVAEDFVRPGHVFPLRAVDDGVLKRAGHTEAAVDLARLAGGAPAGVLCEVVSPDRRSMARGPQLRSLAERHGLVITSVAELVRHRLHTERLVVRTASARVPTRYGEFECHAWRSTQDGIEHLAFAKGDISGGEPVLTRVHSECLTGDIFGSERCDCGGQLDDAMRRIATEGRGVVVYLRGQEGRGIGLGHKLAAYNLQDRGRDTVDANLDLGFPVDTREYGIGAQILRDLGVAELRLMTNNPAKYEGLTGYGLKILERVPLPPRRTPHNVAYLDAKRRRMGHWLTEIAAAPEAGQ